MGHVLHVAWAALSASIMKDAFLAWRAFTLAVLTHALYVLLAALSVYLYKYVLLAIMASILLPQGYASHVNILVSRAIQVHNVLSVLLDIFYLNLVYAKNVMKVA